MEADRAVPKTSMSVDEFLAWAVDRPGRYELVDGDVLAMSPQKVRHAEVKGSVFLALRNAVRASGISCRAMPDGMTIRVGERTAYEPDALVCRGPRLAGDAVEVPEPVIVVEVLSPGTRRVDTGRKFSGYFSLPSVHHYLVVNPESRVVTHHWRGPGDLVSSRIAADGELRLDPPGLDVSVADLFSSD